MSKTINYLIFSGGGAKGIGAGAVLSLLTNAGILNNIQGYAGTSIGAWLAFVLCIGYTPEEIRNEMLTEDASQSIIGKLNPLRLFLEANAYGLNSGELLMNKIRRAIQSKFNTPSITFEELYSLTGKHLKIYACNLNLGKAVEFDYLTEPCMDVAVAVRASMSLPIVFDPVIHNGDCLVDGGMLYNFPYNAFDHELSLGFKFVKSLSSDGIVSSEPTRDPITNRMEFFEQLIICTMRNSDASVPSELLICEIEVGDTNARDFNLTKEQRRALDFLGFKSGMLFLNNHLHIFHTKI